MTNYNDLLKNNDKLKKLSGVQKLDIQDYINMRERNLPSTVKWDYIKSNWVTDNGVTIWQLSEGFFNSEFRPIGMIEPPLSLLKWIIN